MTTLRQFLPAILALSSACRGRPADDVRTFANAAGDYVLVRRDGRSLPDTRVIPGANTSCTNTLLRDVITLREDGSFAEVLEARNQCANAPPKDIESKAKGRFELRGVLGDSVILHILDPQSPDLTQSGRLNGNSFR